MGSAAIADWKVKEVKDLSQVISSPSIVGIINLENLPAKQLQKMRASLRSGMKMRMAKKTLFERAITESKKEGLKELIPHFKGPCVIVMTEMNPFKLYATINKNKSSAPAKAGAIAPEDVKVKAGKTDMIPGPDLSVLKQAGLETKIQEGKIAVAKDKVVVRAGEVISDKVAAALTKLKIEPLKVGMNLVAVCEGGSVFTGSVLKIDEEEYAGNFATAYSSAFNLAFNAGIHNKDTLPLMMSKAFSDARALAIEANILTKETITQVIQKAGRQSAALAAVIPEQVEAAGQKQSAEAVDKEHPAESVETDLKAEAAETETDSKKEESSAEEAKSGDSAEPKSDDSAEPKADKAARAEPAEKFSDKESKKETLADSKK